MTTKTSPRKTLARTPTLPLNPYPHNAQRDDESVKSSSAPHEMEARDSVRYHALCEVWVGSGHNNFHSIALGCLVQ